MAYEKLSLRSLVDLDGGRLAETFDQALRRCMADCEDRPGVDGKRKLRLTLSIKPLQAEDGSLESCDVEFDFDEGIPKRSSKAYNMRSQGQGSLWFNQYAPENAGQRTIDDAMEAEEVAHAR